MLSPSKKLGYLLLNLNLLFQVLLSGNEDEDEGDPLSKQ